MHAALARAHCEKRRTTYVRTYVRTHVRTYARTYVRTYASNTVSRHFGAETKNYEVVSMAFFYTALVSATLVGFVVTGIFIVNVNNSFVYQVAWVGL